jgi:hypothetical protein
MAPLFHCDAWWLQNAIICFGLMYVHGAFLFHHHITANVWTLELGQ